MARQYAGSFCSVSKVKVKAETAYWGVFVPAKPRDLCVWEGIVLEKDI